MKEPTHTATETAEAGRTTATPRTPRKTFAGIFGRAWRDPALRAAVYVFALSRLVVFAAFVVGGQIGHVMSGSYQTTRDFHLELGRVPVSRILRENVQVADINWYHGIAENGYEKRPFTTDRPHNWAFFPLFPLLWRAASWLTGEMVVTGIVLSNLFFFFALVLLYKLALAFGLDVADARRCLFYLGVFPVSYFFSLPLTESLFLLLTVGSFYAARRGRWWLSGVLGALASATRVTGVLLLPSLLLLYWQTRGRDFKRPEVLAPLLVPLGLVAFMSYLYAVTGNPFAFKDILVTWGRGTGLFLIPLLQFLAEPTLIAIPWDFKLVNFGASVTALACGAVLLKRREWALGCYTLASSVVALSSLLLQSQARYAMVLFPVFMVLAVAGRRPRLDEIIRFVFVALLGLMLALFAAHFSLAMA
ncbi:MAG TPA: mannosyltransferase family protein [Pyrinomonadaceae bacterium]|nr:mannosyltransferase family protein [Pyrinomonadaceae bacterium]